MKKLITIVLTMLVAGTLSFAQTGGGSTDTKAPKTEGKKATKTSKAHKGGKKSKKSSGGSTTPPPK
jgi:Ni/Co efflux regulator RcnB